jgi:predicted transcriptional regulator
MKDDYLTLRLPRELARALARWARDRGLPKSHVVREAVTRYLALSAAPPETTRTLAASDLAARWSGLPRLSAEEARDLEADLAAARRSLPEPPAPWA